MCALANGLPGDAAIHRHGTWSRADEIAALAVERQELWGVLLAKAWGIKPLPDTIEIRHGDRPVESKPSRTTNDPDEIRRFMAGQGR